MKQFLGLSGRRQFIVRQRDLALEAVYLREEEVVAGSPRDRQGVIERAQGRIGPARSHVGIGQQASEPATGEPGIHRLIPVQSRPHLVQAIVDLPKLSQCPSAQDGRLKLPVQKPVFGRNDHHPIGVSLVPSTFRICWQR